MGVDIGVVGVGVGVEGGKREEKERRREMVRMQIIYIERERKGW